MNSRTQDQTREKHTPSLKALKLDKSKLIAFYAENMDGSDSEFGYIKHTSIRQVKLTKKQLRKIQGLLSITNWALIRVLTQSSKVDRIVEKYTYDVRYKIDECEKWLCHRVGPQGQGQQFNHVWQQVEETIGEALSNIAPGTWHSESLA